MRIHPSVADQQDGVFTRAQAKAEGFSPYQIRRRVQDGVWTVLGPHVFHVTGRAPGQRPRILAAALVTGGVVSHWSAATLHGIEAPMPDEQARTGLHVTTSRPLHVNVEGVVEHRLRVGKADVVQLGGVSVTSRTRTLIDLMASLGDRDAAQLLFWAVQQGWMDRPTLEQWASIRPGWHGTPRLHRLSARLDTGAHAVSERELHALLDAAGIAYEANVTIRCSDGTAAIVDVLLEATRTIIEIDGRRYHSSPEVFQRDRRRQNALVNDGYTVLRFTWFDLIDRPAHVISVIKRQLAAAA
jgi:hypothetical protein